MPDNVKIRKSKEFQLKVDYSENGPIGSLNWEGDDTIFNKVSDALINAISSLSGSSPSGLRIEHNNWKRTGIRFDTTDSDFKKRKLTLAIEGQKDPAKTKLKCKQHHFIPEMLYDTPANAHVYPNPNTAFEYEKHDATLKLEQDIHLDNTKYCATGSLYIENDRTRDFESKGIRLDFFYKYFANLKDLMVLQDDTPLVPVQHWIEVIYDITTVWDDDKIDSWMLVTRWNAYDKSLVESELSFKFQKEHKDWNLDLLKKRCMLYDALGKNPLFKPLPPIFTFADPVSSFEITKS